MVVNNSLKKRSQTKFCVVCLVRMSIQAGKAGAYTHLRCETPFGKCPSALKLKVKSHPSSTVRDPKIAAPILLGLPDGSQQITQEAKSVDPDHTTYRSIRSLPRHLKEGENLLQSVETYLGSGLPETVMCIYRDNTRRTTTCREEKRLVRSPSPDRRHLSAVAGTIMYSPSLEQRWSFFWLKASLADGPEPFWVNYYHQQPFVSEIPTQRQE